MRITCPDCGASYDVPETLLAAGRPVRCARCSGEWVPLAEAAPDAEADGVDGGGVEAGGAPEPAWPAQPVGEATLAGPVAPSEAAPRLVAMSPPAWRSPAPAAPSGRPRGQRLAVAGWAATAVVLAAALWGAYVARVPVMRAWPPSTRFYAALGLAH